MLKYCRFVNKKLTMKPLQIEVSIPLRKGVTGGGQVAHAEKRTSRLID